MRSFRRAGLAAAAVVLGTWTQAHAQGASRINFAAFAPRLSDIAAGNIAGPDHAAAYQRQMNQVTASQAATMGMTATQSTIDAIFSGGRSLMTSVPYMAMQAGMAAQAQASQDIVNAARARGQAERAASQPVPDPDRPAEAQAILSVIEKGYGSGTAWQNPQTGASGRVTIRPVVKGSFKGQDCRLVQREWRGGGKARKGDMVACRSNGEWYALS
jgi:hypothetical protein